MKILLVSMAIGAPYLEEYGLLFRPSHEAYARRCGYDFYVVTRFIDPTVPPDKRHLAVYFQKMLVCSPPNITQAYDYVIYVDADILIHPRAPPIPLHDMGDRIGIVDEFSQPTPETRLALQAKMGWELSATAYYARGGFNLQTTRVLNSGVLVMQPRLHREFMESVYHTYLPQHYRSSRGPHYEQTALGYELQTQGRYTLLDNRFNALWAIEKYSYAERPASLAEFYAENWFVHFAGRVDLEQIPRLLVMTGGPASPTPVREPYPEDILLAEQT